MRCHLPAGLLWLGSLLWAAPGLSGAAEVPMAVRIEGPREGARVLGGEPVVYVRGAAHARGDPAGGDPP